VRGSSWPQPLAPDTISAWLHRMHWIGVTWHWFTLVIGPEATFLIAFFFLRILNRLMCQLALKTLGPLLCFGLKSTILDLISTVGRPA